MTDSRSWAELLEADPAAVLDILRFVASNTAPGGMQVLLRLSREGHPSLLVGIEDEHFDPEDQDLLGRGGVALIAQEYARMLREGDVNALTVGRTALLDLTQGLVSPTPDGRLEALVQAGAYIAEQLDQVIEHKAGIT